MRWTLTNNATSECSLGLTTELKKNQSIEQGLRLKKTAFQFNFGRKWFFVCLFRSDSSQILKLSFSNQTNLKSCKAGELLRKGISLKSSPTIDLSQIFQRPSRGNLLRWDPEILMPLVEHSPLSNTRPLEQTFFRIKMS